MVALFRPQEGWRFWEMGKGTRAGFDRPKAYWKRLICSEKQTSLGAFSELKETTPSVQCLITIWQLRLWINNHIYLRWLLCLGRHSSLFQYWAKGLSLIPDWAVCQRQLERTQALASDSARSEWITLSFISSSVKWKQLLP